MQVPSYTDDLVGQMLVPEISVIPGSNFFSETQEGETSEPVSIETINKQLKGLQKVSGDSIEFFKLEDEPDLSFEQFKKSREMEQK